MNRLISILQSLHPFVRRRGTVRFMFPAVLAFAALLGAASVIDSERTSYVRLEASETTVEAGGRFSIDVYANAHVAVNAVDITLQFESNSVEVLAVDRGQSVITIWTEDPIIEADRVVLRGGTYRRGFIGEHKIATVDLRAKVTGQQSFSATNVMLLAGDGAGSTVSTSEVNDGTVNLFIYDENTTPESIGVDVSVRLVTDIDGDGQVTLRDISAFMAAWNDASVQYDFNGDGRMTFRDFSIILADYFFK